VDDKHVDGRSKVIFAEELKRRRGMKPEEVTGEADKFFIDKHNELAAKVEEVFLENIKGLPPEMIKDEAWQTVGWFQKYMEQGGFCLPGERVVLNEEGRTLLHSYRVDRRDLLAAATTFKKALKSVRILTNDIGAWDEFQRRLWECADTEDTKRTRRDLFVLQALSGLEMISGTIEAMLVEGTLFERSKWVLQKTRRAIIVRLAFLLEWSRNPNKNPNTLSALQSFLKTMTKMDDWGVGKETSGNTFLQLVKDVFEALGLTDPSRDGALSGTTIRKDILAAVKEFEEITNKFKPENP
jgi:hypothetical protein